MNVLLFELAMTAYLVVAVLFAVYLAGRREMLTRACLTGTVIGFLFHTAAIGSQWFHTGGFPVTNAYESASFFSWMLVLVFLLFDIRHKTHVLGAFVVPIAFLSVFAAALLRDGAEQIDPSLQGFGLALHTTLVLAGSVAFCISFAVGIMYLIQMRLLKSKKFNNLYHRLPPLDACDLTIGRGILVGFPLMTLGLLAGAIGSKFVTGYYWTWTPKQTLSFLIWAFYLTMVLGRYWFGLRAQRGAYLAVFGFIGVLLSFLGLDVILGGDSHF
ncbi:MAG: inner membrane protein YpjD [Leptospirillia bacterium]